MTVFKIHNTKGDNYCFRLHFKTRFLPAILNGNICTGEENCLNDIKITQQQIVHIKNLAFTRNKKGYGFTIFSPNGKPVAHSRFFPTPHLMKRILSILQNRIRSASVQLVPGSIKFTRAA